jgi:hypothetical protein
MDRPHDPEAEPVKTANEREQFFGRRGWEGAKTAHLRQDPERAGPTQLTEIVAAGYDQD